jgi:hypothetical protein
MPEKAHKYKEKRELSYLSRFPIFMETVGLEHNDITLFKPFVGFLVAYGLHESTKKSPGGFSPGLLLCEKHMRVVMFFSLI